VPWSGAPDCPVHHRTVSGVPGNLAPNSSPSRKSEAAPLYFTGLSGEAPDSVRWHTGLSDVPAEQRLIQAPTVDCNAFNARLRAQRSEHAQLTHQTVYRTCPVHHRTAQRPHQSELQRSNPNGRVTWLAHRTVSVAHRTVWCAMRQQPPPNG
jgi:hypothetical protein